MSQDQIDPIGTIPGTLDELGATFKARDAEVIRAVNTNHRLMLAKFDEGEHRFNRLEQNLSENTRKTNKIDKTLTSLSEELGEMIEEAKAAKGAIKVLNWVGALAKPLGYIAIFVGACISAYTAVKAGLGIK
jgi:ABC-type transporter Mla subunit MlaD